VISIVIPVYKNQDSLDRLLSELSALNASMPEPLEVVFVVDGSTDRSLAILQGKLPGCPFQWQLISLSRNFGAWSALSAGMARARGDYVAAMAADLQEPPELMIRFLEVLAAGRADIVIGRRDRRSDPWFSLMCSRLYWAAYRTFVVKDIPPGGVDVFAITREVRDVLVAFNEASTSLVALLFWIGFRREFVEYARAPRLEGKSAWTFGKKLRLAVNMVFNFSDLPLQLLLFVGGFGMVASLIWGVVVLAARILGLISVPGYTALIVAIGFFGGLTSMGLGIIGQYLWLVLQNVRNRPNYIIASIDEKAQENGKRHS
jgi:glycosyltransferase involved in cell wall biosynthesis